MWWWYCCLLVLVLRSCEVRSVIWSRCSEKHQVVPQEIRVQDSAVYGYGQTASQEARRLFKRQSSTTNGTNIGFTAALTGDNHPHGLVHWTGFPSEVLFMLTRSVVNGVSRESWLWRSTDYGHTFSNDTVMWNNDTIINWYYISPLSDNLIFADIMHRMLWVTRDEGASYSSSSTPFAPNRLVFQSRLAPGSNSTTLSQYVLGYDEASSELWVSANLGTNWQRLGVDIQRITHFSWRMLSSAVENNTTVYYEQTMNATHSQLWVSTFPYTNSHLFGNLPPFLTNTFILSNEYMFVQMNTTSSAQYSSPLWVSRNRQPFRQARFPLQSQERHYAVVDTSEGQVFMGVYHDINNTNLYLSEVDGVDYSLSLTTLVSPPESEWTQGFPKFDLHVVEGLVGTFIANTKDPSGRFGSTVISYDKGGNWVQLRPPTLDRDGRFIDCQQPNCSLHLHIQASRDTGFQSILTQDSAIGLIMAAGNLGSSLVNNNLQLRQYFSRDGGFTWLEVDTGFKQYQFAAQGAIVASVSVFQRTSAAKWSCDEGGTWEDVNFVDGGSGVNVIGMLTEPGERALHVTIFGIKFPFVEWLVIDLDFTPVLPNQCTPHDFFTWVPTDDRPGSRCLLGESITYERRSADVCCYVEPGYNRLISRSVCTCSLEDFECDFGFEHIFLNSPCTPMSGFLWPPPQPSNCREGSNYTISSGYRKVAGDKCIRGQELSYFPIVRRCIVGAPKILSLQTNSFIITPEVAVTFTIIQIEGGKLATVYRWDFNDTNTINITGYEHAKQRMHAFALPGVYNVTVLASNNGGSSFFSLSVTVLDPVSAVQIQPPSKLTSRKELPVDVELVFGSNVSTTYGTAVTGPMQYLWSIDGINVGNTPTITHTFTQPGTYGVTLSVLNAGPNVATFTLAVNILDQLTGVDVHLPHADDLIAGVELSFTSSFTTHYQSVTGSITYLWDFGDGITNTSTGSLISHTYPAPGNYTIRLTADNFFTRSSVFAEVVLLDKLSSVEIVPPMQTIRGEVPAMFQLVFRAMIFTEYNTTVTGSLQFSWNFGDASPTATGAIGFHTFTRDDDFTVRCTVTQGTAQSRTVISKQAVLLVSVFEASDSSSVEIRSSDLIGGSFVLTGQVLTWRVESIEGTGHKIPSDTNFKWTTSRSDVTTEPSCPNFMEESRWPEYNLTLSCWGPYDVTVIGNHSAGSFVSVLPITAEAAITEVMVTGVPAVLRSGALTHLTLLSKSGTAVYHGPITLFVRNVNGSELTTPTVDLNTAGSNTVMVQLSRDEATTPEKKLIIIASNGVSNISRSASVTLAVRGEYVELSVIFLTSRLPSNYKSSSFQEALQTALELTVRTHYLTSYPNSLVEIEGSGVRLNGSNSSSNGPPIVTPQEVLYVDLDILPKSLQQRDIQAIKNVPVKMMADIADGTLSVMVGGESISVGAVEFRSYQPPIIVQPTNTTLYIGLGAGLGVGLILILAIAVVLGVVLYIYRRNYKRL